MKEIKPIYIKVLIAAIIVYVIGSTFMFSELYIRYERVRHKLLHGHFE